MHIHELTIGNKYELLEQIGEGTFGLVFKAKQQSTGQTVAVKTLKVPQGLSEQSLKQKLARFERETQLCAKINHPNIVKLLDKGYAPNGEPYAVFEFVQGDTLRAHIVQNGQLSPVEMSNIMGQVLEALDYVHEQGIIHRDLKPSNIMIEDHGKKKYAKVLDFGIGAFNLDVLPQDYQQLTMTHEMLGTPTYSSPEQLRGEPPTVKSDLYTWGLIAIECLTGQPVMNGNSIAEVFQQQLISERVPIPSTILNHSLGNLLKRVLDKKTTDRVGEASLILEQFEQINFNTLTGLIQQLPSRHINSEYTMTNESILNSFIQSQKQLTVLCLKLTITALPNKYLDLNILDTIQDDLLNQCKDIALRYGGWVSQPFMNNLAIYFGYPDSNDSDARRTGRTALELVTEMKKRGVLLLKQYSLNLNIQIGIHTGHVILRPNQYPKGNVPNSAFDLVYKAAEGSILVSHSAKKLLTPFLEFEEAQPNQYLSSEKTYSVTNERRTEALFYRKPNGVSNNMVGRDEERSFILDKWNKLPFIGSATIITGQAGIGKSRLIHEIKLEIQAQQNTIVECRCFQEHENNALYPFFRMLRDYWGLGKISDDIEVVLALKEVLEQADCSIDDSLPILCSWLSIPLSEQFSVKQMSPEEQKQVLFSVLKKCILQIDTQSPFLLVLEDLHWIDATSIEFVKFLLSDLDDQQVLLLMTTRPEQENKLDDEKLSQIELDILKDKSIEQMILEYLNSQEVSGEVLEYIEKRTDGIPLFIEELTNMLVEQKFIVLNNGVYEFAEDADLHKIPETTQDLLNAKLDRLNFAKETAQLAAAIGREFSYQLLVKASLKGEAEVQNDLSTLIQADIVYQQRNVHDNVYHFRHALIRDAAYDSMLPQARKDVHSNIVDVLREFFPKHIKESAFEFAQHLAGAEEFEEAIKSGIEHVDSLITKSLFHEALTVINKIERWVGNIEDEVEQKYLKLKLNSLLPTVCYNNTNDDFWTEKLDRVNKENQDILEFLKTTDKAKDFPEVKNAILKDEILQAYYWHAKGQGKEALALSEEILKREEHSDSKLLMMLRYIIGHRSFFNGDIERAEKELNALKNENTNYTELYRELGMAPNIQAHLVLANKHAAYGEYDKMLYYLNKGTQLSSEIKNTVDILISYAYRGFLMAIYQDQDAVRQCISEFENSKLTAVVEIAELMSFAKDWLHQETQKSEIVRQKYIKNGEVGYLIWYEVLMLDTLLKQKNFDKVYALSTEIKDRLISRNELVYLPKVYNFLISSLYMIKGKETSLVEELLNEGVASAKKLNNKWLELLIKYNYAKVLEENNDYSRADSLRKSITEIIAHFPYNNPIINSIKLYLKRTK